ncbi:hypothetical protein Aeqsu_1357 [Aequorivita sublithincola DSM 14238]|uniref:Outer membrane protein beta-barrel domain-containing protein n=1 Tax=Aequorivita sublithincola (strain DSM 14238 / LMG 21431 / ACAM 643 / 9-3) TaxID=746697 RepID=I3YV32_AEQSU|nr:DUF6646 family protein [Aequorivita sublithincola]AFL80850.1 hypothetical protein Aeqsu_1357 [Aequorivita sublithincola DSM 14238]
MKTLVALLALLFFQFSFGQAYSGKGDVKFQVGANFQNNGTGIMGSLDFGLGENISVGVASAYLLGVEKVRDLEGNETPFAKFDDRFDLKARFNANLGNVINVDENFDIYPGLYASLKNFGGHLGARYFFTSGFGVFTEVSVPISKYNTDSLTPAEKLHNQVSVNVGASFNI